MKNKDQLLFRCDENWWRTIDEIKTKIGFSKQQILADAVALYFGKPDRLAEERSRIVAKALRDGKVTRPFNSPLAPFGGNVVVG